MSNAHDGLSSTAIVAVALKAGTKCAGSALAALQMDAENAREEANALRKEALGLRQQVNELRTALHGSSHRLREYQQKDVEVYTRIREAMEIAEQNKLAHDASVLREQALQAEVAKLRERLGGGAREGRSGRDDEDGGEGGAWEAKRLKRELEHAQRSLCDLEDEVVELRSCNARLERDKRSLREELEARAVGSSTGQAGEALSALQKALDAQKERDVLAQQLATLQRAVQRGKNEDDVRRQQLESQLEDVRNQLSHLQVSASMAKSDAAGFLRQLEQTKKQLSSLKAAKRRSEEEMRGHVSAVRAERDAEVKILASKLEDAINSYNRSVTEAERMLAAKENILRKYKSEAQGIASKLASEQARAASVASSYHVVQRHAHKLEAENEALEGDLQSYMRATDEGMAAQTRAAEVLAGSTVSKQRFDELSRRLRDAELERDRAQLERDRALRAAESGRVRPVTALRVA